MVCRCLMVIVSETSLEFSAVAPQSLLDVLHDPFALVLAGRG